MSLGSEVAEKVSPMHGGIGAKRGLVWSMVLVTLLFGLSPAYGGTIYENFNNNTFNHTLFWLNNEGVASSLVDNNRLEISIPANSGSFFSVGGLELYDQFSLKGDFDVQVDFNLLAWPVANGCNAGIISNNFEVCRKSYHDNFLGNVEAYLAYFAPGQEHFWVNTSDTSGKLRLKRTGNTIEASYWKSGGWMSIGSHTDPQLGAQATAYIGAYSGGSGASETVLAAFDNYQITNKYLGNGATTAILQLLLD